VNFARQGKIKFPLLRDPDLRVADAYGVAMQNREIAIPSTFIVDREGNIHWKTVGETQMDRADFDEVLELIDGLL
jgi:alkyl hydroperoxide reductase subunit AhpC